MIPHKAANKEIPDEWFGKPPTPKEIPEGTFVVITDAGYKRRIAGVGVVIRTKNREYSVKKHSAICKGPNHAELTSVKMGLRDLVRIRKEVKRVVVYNDNLWGYRALQGDSIPKRDHLQKVLGEIEELDERIGCPVRYLYVPGKTVRRVDRIAGRVRVGRESEKEEQIQKRLERVQRASERGTSIRIVEKGGSHYAYSSSKPDKSYRVNLQPPSCECPGWTIRYGKRELIEIAARALPCKHLCALAEYLDTDIFLEFWTQIYRRD